MFKTSIFDVKTTLPIFQELVSGVVLPGEEGELSILDFHQTIVVCLKKGIIKINKIRSIAINRGIAKMENNQLTILVEKQSGNIFL